MLDWSPVDHRFAPARRLARQHPGCDPMPAPTTLSHVPPRAAPPRPRPGAARRGGRALALSLSLAALAGCAGSADTRALRVGVSVFTGYAPLTRALRTYEPPPGAAPIRLHRFSAYADSLRAFRNGRIDLVPMTQYDALLMHARGVPLVAVALLDRSLGADALVSQPEYETLRDLRGRRIGLTVDSVNYFLLLQALDRHDMVVEDFEIVNLNQDLLEDAFRARRVQAAVLWEPFVSNLGDRARPLLTSRELKIPIVDLLWARADRLPRIRGDLVPLLRHYFATLAELAREPASLHVRLAEESHAPPRDTRLALRGLRLFDPRDNLAVARATARSGEEKVEPPDECALRQTADFLYARTLLAVPLATAGLFDPRPLLEALAGAPGERP